MARTQAKRELVPIGAGGKPRMRMASRGSWTKEKEREFLAVLADTCNVRVASEAAGMSTQAAYWRRKRNAAFRTAWAEAVAAAYHKLELVLIERTLNGTEKIMQRHDGSEDRMREYPNNLGLALLKLRRSTVETVQRPAAIDDGDEVRERLVQKLLRLKKRREQQ